MFNEKMRNLLNTLDQIEEGKKLAGDASSIKLIAADFPAQTSPPVKAEPMPRRPITGKGSLHSRSPKLKPVKF